MARYRTVPEKVSDWLMAYNAIAAEVTPPELRKMQALFNGVIGEATTPAEGIELLQQSMALARLISANDRSSAMAAAILTSSGGAVRPITEETE